MDDLIKKVVEKLSLSVDKAPEVYEHLKMQFVVYDICNYFLYTLVTTSVLVSLGLLINFMAIEYSYSEEKAYHRKIGRYLTITLIISLIATTGIYIFRNLHTQDILFLREMVMGG